MKDECENLVRACGDRWMQRWSEESKRADAAVARAEAYQRQILDLLIENDRLKQKMLKMRKR